MRAFTIIFIISLIFPQICPAKPNQNIEKEEPNYLLDFSLLAAGIFTQYPLTHEIGHWVGGRVTEKNIEFSSSNIGEWDIRGKKISDQDKNIIVSSGFILPIIVSEAILDLPISKSNPYTIGIIISPLVHNISYIIQDIAEVKDEKYNDFETMEKAGIGREWTYSLALIIPAIQCYRLLQDKDFKTRWDIWFGGDKIGIEYKF